MSTAEAIVAPADTAGGTLDTALDAARIGAPEQLPVTSPVALSYFAAHPRRPQVYFGDYLLLQTLGEGEFGKVKLGVHRKWGEETAIKLIKREKVAAAEELEADPTKLSKVEREIQVLKVRCPLTQELRHPNVVHLYEVIESERYIGIVLEYGAGGELFDYILAHKCLKERDACRLFAQLISGVSYMHRKKIIHRDLKLENLLLDRNRNVIITDFGFANNFAARGNDLMATSCGSPCYAAPELVVQDGMYVGAAVDVWSCGVILYAMLAGYLPFDDDPANPDGDNINLLYKYIMATPLTFPDYVGAEPRSLLLRMLVPDPAQRAMLDEVMAHPWLAPYRDLFRFSVTDLERAAIEQQAQNRQVYREQMLYQQKLLEQQLAEKPPTHPVSGERPAKKEPLPASASLGALPESLPRVVEPLAQPPAEPPQPAEPAQPESTKRKVAPETTEQPAKLHAVDETRADARAARSTPGVKARVLSSGMGPELSLSAPGSGMRHASSQTSRRSPSDTESVSRSNSGSSKKNARLTPLAQARAEAVGKSEGRVQESRAVHTAPVEAPKPTEAPAPPVLPAPLEQPMPTEAGPAVPPPEPVGAEAAPAPMRHSPEADRDAADATNAAAPAPASAPAPMPAPVEAPVLMPAEAPAPATVPALDATTPAATTPLIPTARPSLDATDEQGLAPPLVFNAGMPPTLASLPPPAGRLSRESTLTSFGQVPLSLTSYLPQRLGETGRPRKASTSKPDTDAQPMRPASPVAPVPAPAPAAAGATTTAPHIPRKQLPTEDVASAALPKKRPTAPVSPRKSERPRPLSMQTVPAEPIMVPSASMGTMPSAPGRVSLDTTLERPMLPPTSGRAGRAGEKRASWWRRLSGTHHAPAAAAPAAPLAAVPEDKRRGRTETARKPLPVLRTDHNGLPAAVSFAANDRRYSAQHEQRTDAEARRMSVAGDARTVPRHVRPELEDHRLAMHVGAVDQAALTTRPPEEVMRDVVEALYSMGIEMRRARTVEFRIECVRAKRPGFLRQLFGRKRDEAHSTRWSRLGRGRPISAAGDARNSFSQDDVERAMSRMSISGLPSSNTGLSRFSLDDPYTLPRTEPLYGQGSRDGGHEIRFSVELTKIPTLQGLYSVDIRRIKGNAWSYKFLYQALLERIELGGSVPVRR